MNVVIFGAPGSGKGTQSEKLIERYGLHHISTGEVLRDHIARKTPIGQIAKTYINQGQLIPDSLMIKILEEIIDNDPKAKDGVILDGFPRTIPQAEALNRFLEKRGQKIHHVVDEADISFTVRYCKKASVIDSTGYRVVFGGGIYDILAVDHMNYKKKCIKFKCRKARR